MYSDLISRSELLKLVPPEEIVARMAIMNAPTVEERPTGEWIKDEQGIYRCSKCFHKCIEFVMGQPKDNFCIECGAKMKGGEEE